MAAARLRSATGPAPWIVGLIALAIVVDGSAQDRADRRPARPRVTLPDGPVRQVIRDSCTACHGIDEYGYYAMGRDDWEALIERMQRTPSGVVPGAVISDSNKALLLDWLVAGFGPDAEPFPREYVVREITDATRLDDAEATARLDAACGACHSPLAPVLGTALDAAGWRNTLSGKIATGTPLLIDEVDPLVDWLTRTPTTR
jgi:cytochrome c5